MDKKTEEKPVKAATTPAPRFSQEKLADGTINIKINVPAAEVEKAREGVVSELVKNVEIQGFRKGAAPRHLAEQRLNKQTVQEEVMKKVLTAEYIAAVKELGVQPIINPRIHVEAFEEGTNLEFVAETCETPDVNLGNYKEELKKIKPEAPKIILPGQEAAAGESKDAPRKLDEILNVIISNAKVSIPKILIDQEADRLLSQLLDEIKRLGVSLDQYLASRQKNAEELRAEYSERAEKDLKLEFVLRKVADEEKITVEEQDIKLALDAVTDPKERDQIAQNPYLVAAIIRQQKTLDFLARI
ncbi:MAG TPA: trigger factor [Patescibacteria group bacterium]|nr:trigger factor [Patescibacteria group bacterium]